MRIISVDLANETSRYINLGHNGEYNTTEIRFDIKTFVELYGEGRGEVVYKPYKEEPYITVTTQTEEYVSLVVSAHETAITGNGELSLYWYVNNGLAKTIKFNTLVTNSFEDIGEPPVEYPSWIDTLTELSAETLGHANTCEEAKVICEEAKVICVETKETAVEYSQKIEEEYNNFNVRAENVKKLIDEFEEKINSLDAREVEY